MILLPAAIVAPYLLLASQLSGLPIPADAAPSVALTEQIFSRRLGWDQGEAIGLTDEKTGLVFLYSGWRAGDNDSCVLVHELTHYLQVVNHVPYVLKEWEVQAWDVTAKCYEYRGEMIRAHWALQRKEDYRK